MFIIFKDGSTTQVPTSRIEFKDGLAIGYGYDTWDSSLGHNVRPAVAVISMQHVSAVLEGFPAIAPPPQPPAPPTPIPARLAPAMPYDGVEIT